MVLLQGVKLAQLGWMRARQHTGRYGWTQNQKLHRKFGPGERTPPPFIGPKYMTNNNWRNMSTWNKGQFIFDSTAKQAAFIKYFFSELRAADWDPKKVTWLIAKSIPLLSTEIKGLYYTLRVLRAGGGFTGLEAFIFITTGTVALLDKYSFGMSSVFLKKIATNVIPYLTVKTAQLSWYSFKKMLRLMVYILSGLSKSPSLLRRVIEMAKKIRRVEKSPKRALSLVVSKSPSTTAILKKAGNALTPNELAKYRKIIAAVAKPQPRTPTPRPRIPTPKPRTPTPKPRTPTPKPRTPTPKPRTATARRVNMGTSPMVMI